MGSRLVARGVKHNLWSVSVHRSYCGSSYLGIRALILRCSGTGVLESLAAPPTQRNPEIGCACVLEFPGGFSLTSRTAACQMLGVSEKELSSASSESMALHRVKSVRSRHYGGSISSLPQGWRSQRCG
jgi:hypothetical protein